jgi:hypothetical protein
MVKLLGECIFTRALLEKDTKLIKTLCYADENTLVKINKKSFQYYLSRFSYYDSYKEHIVSISRIFLNFCGHGTYTNTHVCCYCNYYYEAYNNDTKKGRVHLNYCKRKNFVFSDDYIYFTDMCSKPGLEPCELDYFLDGKKLLEMEPVVYYSLRKYIKTLINVTNENSIELYRIYIINKQLSKYVIKDIIRIILSF